MSKRFFLQRGGPDALTEELINAFSGGEYVEFKPLFDLVYAGLRARNVAHGGEEMLRLRVYEKLQWLVRMGGADKTGKAYRGNSKKLRPITEQLAAKHCRDLLDAARHAVPERSSSEIGGDGFGEVPVFPRRS